MRKLDRAGKEIVSVKERQARELEGNEKLDRIGRKIASVKEEKESWSNGRRKLDCERQ